MIPYGRQDITEEDIQAVVAVLRSDWLTQGPAIASFERAVAGLCNVQHAVAMSNATAALHVACLALELGPGDLLWTSPITFVASSNAALYCGADVDFVDIDPRTYNMSVDALAAKLEHADAAGRLPKVVMPVHLAGQSCEMRPIRRLADRYGFKIVEDASHAIGGQYEGRPIGACSHSDIAVFSFHPVKIITTCEGGLAVTRNDNLAERMQRLRTHGVTRDQSQMKGESQGPWYYEQIELGYNYRITDVQAALGESQLRRLRHYIARRCEIGARYDACLAGKALTRPWQHPDTQSAWHLYVVRLDLEAIGRSRRQVFETMRGAGIGANVHYIPVHLQPHYRALGFRDGMFPEAERYYREAITLPLFPRLTEAEQDEVVDSLLGAVA